MYLGIDSGSVSLKAVIIDENRNIVKSSYKKNHDLITTLKEILKDIKINRKIKGVGVTGTGQEFISKIVGADIKEPEIVCQFTSAIERFPNVRTIIDIGGQDSKLIIIDKNGLIQNIAFNEACSAGTGAVIESIAQELETDIDDVGDLALQSKNNFSFAGKCGIFARTSVIDRKNKGVDKSDIFMGICKALVNNYFAMLAKGKTLEPEFVFQGATAKNKALVRCFEEYLNHKVNIPEYPDITGAYGVALITKEYFKGKTNFKGFELVDVDLKARTFIADGCSNKCEITNLYQSGTHIGFIKNLKNNCEKCVGQETKRLI